MTAILTPMIVFKDWDGNGLPLAFGTVSTFAAGTTTPQATYTDSTQTTPNANPLTLNNRGEAQIWLDPSKVYKIQVKDVLGNQIRVVDQVQGSLTQTQLIAILTQSFLGSILYPRTTAEIAAGVTPTNYYVASHDLCGAAILTRYGGAAGSGDNTTAMTNAAAVLAQEGGGIIDLPYVGEWKMNFVCAQNNLKIRMAGGKAEFDQYCIRPYSLSTPALTFGDGTNPYRYCGLLNCHVSGTNQGQGVGNSPAAANCAPQALLIKGGMIGFTTDARCVLYSGIQTIALVPSATQPVTSSRIEGYARNDTTGTASARVIYSLGVSGTGYNTDNKFVSFKVNSTGIGYAAEIDGTGYGIYFELHAGGYWDIKPGLGILLKNSVLRSQGTQLDPGTSGVVVLETTDSSIKNLAKIVVGLLIADGQQWKNGVPTTFTFPTYSNWYERAASIISPWLGTPIYIPTSTDGFSTTMFIDEDTDTGPLTLNNADWSVKTAGKGLRVKEGSNAKQGTAVLVAGTVVVSNTSVTANSRIFLTSNADGGTPGFVRVSARTASTSFTITSSNAADTSMIAWEIFEPA